MLLDLTQFDIAVLGVALFSFLVGYLVVVLS